MNIRENLVMAFDSIVANKLRSALTMLGIIIGVASVISMVSMGTGAQKQAEERIQGLGTNLIMIRAGRMRFHGPGGASGSSARGLKHADYELIKDKAEYISEIAPEVSKQGVVKYQEKTLNSSIIGSLPSWLEVNNNDMQNGRFINNSDNKSLRNVCVIGFNVSTTLFGALNPVGTDIKLSGNRYEIIGVLKEKGEGQMGGGDDSVIIPYNTARIRLFQTDKLSTINVTARSEKETAKAIDSITSLLRKDRNIKSEKDDDFTIRSQKEMQEMLGSITQTFTMLLGSIAVVSLLVGGIGIMNIMLVTVTERTREIGIRKAIGARSREIMLQFLIESVVLSLVGGIVGIGTGIGIAVLMSSIANWATSVTMNSIVYAFLFSVSIGLFFGLYPAKKAAALDPIDALRYE